MSALLGTFPVLQGHRGNLGKHGPAGALRNLWCNDFTLGQLLTKDNFEVCLNFCDLITCQGRFYTLMNIFEGT